MDFNGGVGVCCSDGRTARRAEADAGGEREGGGEQVATAEEGGGGAKLNTFLTRASLFINELKNCPV